MTQTADFDDLTPDLVMEAVESALDIDLTNYTQPMPSYINRVYELKSEDDEFYIVNVITSYSIHYTKLYESFSDAPGQGRCRL